MSLSLSRSRQDYLKALLALGGQSRVVGTSELALKLDVAPPSVTNMLRRLAKDRLVTLAPGAGAKLSSAGQREALRVVRRHRLLETFLVERLGLDWSEAHEEAEVMEHAVSERVLDALDRLMDHPSEDPHGHPIPDASGRLERRALHPAAALHAGEVAVVREIRDQDARRMARWKAAGLVPGAAVRMRSVDADDDVFELEVAGRALVSGSEGLEGVLVERRRDARTKG